MRSMARCFAVPINQAPGLSGIPLAGHCSSAATSASCARSSASPTSRTIRVSPAMSFADSIRQTASIARWVLEAVTASNHTSAGSEFKPDCAEPWWLGPSRGCLLPGGDLLGHALFPLPDLGCVVLAEIGGLEYRADLDLRLLAGRVRAPLHPLDGLVERLHLEEPEAGDDLLRFGERPVDDRALGAREADAGSLRARLQPFPGEHDAGVHELFVVPRHCAQ